MTKLELVSKVLFDYTIQQGDELVRLLIAKSLIINGYRLVMLRMVHNKLLIAAASDSLCS